MGEISLAHSIGHSIGCKLSNVAYFPRGGGGGVLSYKKLMGMCCWMGLLFHDWKDQNGVAFSVELLEWGHTFLDFWGKRKKK